MSNYEEIVERWVRDFMMTMDDGVLRPGNRSGDEPPGVKIIFDGYGYNEETNEEDNPNLMSFAVFVHKDSLKGEFPEHDEYWFALIHRPKDEVCIWVWYDATDDSVEVIPFEEGDTQLDYDLLYDIIDKIDKGEYEDQVD
jgi:hypothetical protein